MFPEWETQRLLKCNKVNLEQSSQSIPIKEWKFDFNDTMIFLLDKLSSSVTESASENENHKSSFSENESLPDWPIKRKRKQQCIQLLCAEEFSEEQHSENYDRKIGTVENSRIMRQMIQKKNPEKAEEEEQQDIQLQIDSEKKTTIFYPLKVVKELVLFENDDK